MLPYKCPYCGINKSARGNGSKLFTDWAKVKNHITRCKLNTKKYSICNYYGSIENNIINSYESIDDFRRDYPKLTFNASYFCHSRNIGLLTIRAKLWNTTEIIESIKLFYKLNNRIPQELDFIKTNKQYPSCGTVKKYFNTWNNAIQEAGFVTSHGEKYGRRVVAKDGVLYRSMAEAYFVDNYLYDKYTYEYEKPYGNGWFTDFYLPEKDLYIEIDGGLRPERIREKEELLIKNNKKYIIINTVNLYRNDFIL